MHLGGNNPRYQYKMKNDVIESSHVEKDSGLLVNEKLNMSQQGALAAWKGQLRPRLHVLI